MNPSHLELSRFKRYNLNRRLSLLLCPINQVPIFQNYAILIFYGIVHLSISGKLSNTTTYVSFSVRG